jgi:hypothetical protein
VVGVGQQWKRQVVPGGEPGLARLVENADAEDDGITSFQLRQCCLKVA